MRNFIIFILTIVSFQMKAQTCDSLENYGVTHGVPLITLEKLIEANCDKAKLSYAYELLTGYRIKMDSIRAIELLNDCKDSNIDCKYELFKVYYENELERAYKLISEIALIDPIKNCQDSITVVFARLIAADMTERGLGNNEGLTKSVFWYLLYYEIEIVWDESQSKHMIEEMIRVLKMVNDDQFDIAYKNAEIILGHKPIFDRSMIE